MFSDLPKKDQEKLMSVAVTLLQQGSTVETIWKDWEKQGITQAEADEIFKLIGSSK